MKKSCVYTKRGDTGKTSLIGGRRVSKCDSRLEAYGTVDELNANLGVLVSLIKDKKDKSFLFKIQCELFTIGAYLATDFQDEDKACKAHGITDEDIRKIEVAIDEIDVNLPKLKYFVIPGGLTASAVAHVCRTVCRRAERQIVAIKEDIPLIDDLLVYMNRLSDYLFVLSRKINVEGEIDEQLWQNNWI